jgi:V/A-type H+-transporting ATPase subunit I
MVIVGMLLLFIGAGPIGFFDITGYVGDWLSYARLLALGLATAGMSLAFNVVSQLFAEKMIPAILGIIIIMSIIIMVLRFLKKLTKPVFLFLIVITIVFVIILVLFPNEAIGILITGAIKTIVLIILLIMVHMVNLGLQALGAGVHSLRLQYVEFFNRFYEGGGHVFSPFKIKRIYTKIEEEKNLD